MRTNTYTPTEWAGTHLRDGEARRDSVRAHLLAVTDLANWQSITDLANENAEAQGRIDAATQCMNYARAMEGYGLPVLEVVTGLHAYARQAASDDSWSGRKNDARRCYRDGYLTVVGAFVQEVTRS